MRICKSTIFCIAVFLLGIISAGCGSVRPGRTDSAAAKTPRPQRPIARIDNRIPVIHVIVALCDNENQGIVPVSASLGNGEDPETNLYWGAAYGVATYFGKSTSWISIKVPESDRPEILRRIGFRHRDTGAVLIADAYQGSEIKTSISDYLNAASGNYRENLIIDQTTLQIGGSADVLAYVGHNGLMDFELEKPVVDVSNT
jgi:hypothetical protein